MKGCGLGITSSSAEVVPCCKIQQKLSGHLVSVAGSVVDGGAAVDVRGEGGGAHKVAKERLHWFDYAFIWAIQFTTVVWCLNDIEAR